MKKFNDFLLAGIIFVELFMGIVVAPIIFYPANIIGDGVLSHFQSGLLMTQVFVKYNYFLLFVCVFSLAYEVFSKQKLRIFLSILIMILALIFVFYYTQNVLNMQAANATATEAFNANHKQSELLFKLMLFTQVLLFFTKQKENKAKID